MLTHGRSTRLANNAGDAGSLFFQLIVCSSAVYSVNSLEQDTEPEIAPDGFVSFMVACCF